MANRDDRAGGIKEKAYDTNDAFARNRHVNTSSRPVTGSSSRFSHQNNASYDANRRRSRSPARPDRSRSPYRSSRQRSRSPYRKPKETSSGGKRQHNGDHYSSKNSSDPRRFKTYFEDDGRHPSRDNARDSTKSRAEKNGKYNDEAKARKRSRSPFRHDRLVAKQERPLSQSSAEAVTQPLPAVPLEKDTQHMNEEREEPVALSEAELIEQRRRRREAIKAKHKTQQPLLVQALEQNMPSAPNTPLHDSSDVVHAADSPSSINSPRTPRDMSPGSPAPPSPASFAADTMVDLVQHTDTAVDEGPSAADYDPAMDMQEDRVNLQKQTDVPAQPDDNDVDMFADDDDDDMFASESKLKQATNVAKVAKTLDQSLLDNWDYPDGHYRIIIGELLDGKYAVQQQIGKGTFATVVRAQDVNTGRSVAIKIACNNETMYKAGTREMDFLKTLNESDPEDKRHIIRLLGNFDHKAHMCLVFESLNADLRETLKKYGRNIGLNLTALRSFAYQMFQALLHMQRNEILHADLKPDNILVSEKLNVIKVCDLGTAAKINDSEITPYLVSRFYRAPEVMLGMPFDYAIDMWSIGCTLFELYTGRILFAGSDNNQMLRVIQECRGKIPNRMLKKSTLLDRHYDQYGNFVSIERDKITGQTSFRSLTLTKTIPGKDLRARILTNTKDAAPAVVKEVQTFVDLLDKCLQLDPAKRITPADALKHYFISHTSPGDKAEKKMITALAPVRAR